MSNPQQPELARSRKTPAQDQDSVAAVVEGQRDVAADAPRGPIPPENQPGHHPTEEQDKPDLDAFAERLGVGEGAAQAAKAAQRSVAAEATRATGERRTPVLAAVAVAVMVLLLAAVFGRRRRRARRRR